MSDEGFLKRWSRKKRTETPAAEPEAAETPPSNLPPQAGEGLSIPPPRSGGGQEGVPPQARGPHEKTGDDAIDPATRPPIESLGPGSDYTVFLKKGVPEALRLAALRKAWMSDPFIRDFRSPAIDYGWDFTTPDYSLRAGDDVAKMLDQIFAPAAPDANPPPSSPPPSPAPAAKAAPEQGGAAERPKLPQKKAADSVAPTAAAAPAMAEKPRRKHGGALPDEGD